MEVRIYYALQDFIIQGVGLKSYEDHVEKGRVISFLTSIRYELGNIDKHPSSMQLLIDENKVSFMTVDNSLISEKSTAKLYVEDGVLKKDSNYDKRLMKTNEIVFKQKNKLNLEIDEELSKENPSIITIEKKKLDLVKLDNEFSSENIFQIALDGLDARVAKGEPDKPIIRQKLQEKVAIGTPDFKPNTGLNL